MPRTTGLSSVRPIKVADLLGDVLHDDDDVDIRIDGYLADGGLCEGFWRYQGSGVWHVSITFGAYDRPFHKRADAALLRLGLGSDRPGANDAVGVRPRRLRHAGLVDDAPKSSAFRFAIWSRIFRVGRDFSLFPSTLTDTFGERHATTNYGFLYMAQGVGSVIGGPLAAWLHEATNNWTIVFMVMIVMDFVAAIMAVAVLKPLRQKLRHPPSELMEPASLKNL